MTEPGDFVAVAAFSQNTELPIVETQLNAMGIRYHLLGENTVAINPLLSGAIGGVRLMVHPEDAEAAAEIVQELRREQAEAYALAERTCPQCQSENGTAVRRPFIVGLLAVLTLGVFSWVYPWPRHSCPDCGYKWR
jgi:hypothetical protein